MHQCCLALRGRELCLKCPFQIVEIGLAGGQIEQIAFFEIDSLLKNVLLQALTRDKNISPDINFRNIEQILFALFGSKKVDKCL